MDLTTLFTILHVAAAVLFLGPVMVATSAFGKNLLAASQGDSKADGTATTLHGITKLYGYLSVLVPVFGLILLIMDWDIYKTQPNFHTAILLSIIAWIILLAVITPKQSKAIAALSAGDSSFDFTKAKKQQAMFGGIFNLLWVITFVLMFF